MTEAAPATQITAEQLAELNAAFAKATKGEWDTIEHSWEQTGVFAKGRNSRVAVCEIDGDVTEDTEDTFVAIKNYDAAFIALAHNLMPSLIAAAEEAEESRPWVMFYRDGKTLGEIAAHFETTIYEFSPWLTAPMMRATREAESYAFAAGRNGGIEAAAKIVDGYIGCEAIAAAIRALIEKEPANV